MTVCVGVDTGSRWLAWARLDVVRCRGFWLGGGVLDVFELGEARACAMLHEQVLRSDPPAWVGVERIKEVKARRGRLEVRRGQELYDTGCVVGRVMERLSAWDPVEVAAEAVRARWIAPVSPAEAKARKAAGERAKYDAALLAVAQREISGWPAQVHGRGGAYSPKGLLYAEQRSHLVDAALVALEGAWS